MGNPRNMVPDKGLEALFFNKWERYFGNMFMTH